MRYAFKSKKLQRLHETEEGSDAYPPEVVAQFFRAVDIIATARDIRDIRAFTALRLEKLKGRRRNQHSLRLKRQWRLIVELKKQADGTVIWILEIVDYH